jgi:hypothetical protein
MDRMRNFSNGLVNPLQKLTGQDIALFKIGQQVLNRAYTVKLERFVNGPRTILSDRTIALNRAA